MMNFVSNNEKLCIKNEELCIKNEKLCIKNEELLYQKRGIAVSKVMNFESSQGAAAV